MLSFIKYNIVSYLVLYVEHFVNNSSFLDYISPRKLLVVK
jgi:hypothetical protein